MRQSRYAIEAQASEGELLLYNAATGAFARLNKEAALCWDAFGRQGNCSEPTGPVPDELLKRGFLTDLAPEDELAWQRRLFDAQRADASELTLSFIPTYACNYRCPYCYELGHNKIPGKMDERVVSSIMDFLAFKYAQDGFESLSVQWYGGDPSLALDVVEELSDKLISWCDANGVAFKAMMLTNANVIDEAAADLIAQCRITTAFLTIDGPEEVHNRRRVAANGSNSYEQTIRAARLLRARGVRLIANMNTDKVNIVHYKKLHEQLLAEEGIALSMGKLNDYGHFYGCAPFCAPDFDLFTHEEFFHAQLAEFKKLAHTAAELREMLRPARRFCTGQLDNYFIIDLLGDVYRCDGWVGDKDHVRFSLFDDTSQWKLSDITFDATRDETCAECEILPICQGNCHWERVCSDMPCHPFKTTMGDYLRIYEQCCMLEGLACEPAAGVTVLAEPYSAHDLGWEDGGASR